MALKTAKKIASGFVLAAARIFLFIKGRNPVSFDALIVGKQYDVSILGDKLIRFDFLGKNTEEKSVTIKPSLMQRAPIIIPFDMLLFLEVR